MSEASVPILVVVLKFVGESLWGDVASSLAAHCQMVQENESSLSCIRNLCFKIKQNLKVYE